MKKLVALLLVLVIGVTLTACGNSDEYDPLADGVLKVGMDLRWAPFEMKDTSGNPEGISVEVAKALGEYLDVEVEIVDLEFGSLIASLNSRDIDIIIASMSITEERAEAIDFSEPYFYFPLITLLNKDFQDANNVTTKEELFAIDGVKYVGPRSFVSLSIPEEEALNPVILEVNDSTAAVLEVTSGSSDAFIISASSAAEYNKTNESTTALLWDPIDYSPIGMGLRQTDVPSFLESINAFIAQLDSSGTYDDIATIYDSVIAEGLPGQGLEFYLKDE
jgi:polar amino acid transport system substrate-binding protein